MNVCFGSGTVTCDQHKSTACGLLGIQPPPHVLQHMFNLSEDSKGTKNPFLEIQKTWPLRQISARVSWTFFKRLSQMNHPHHITSHGCSYHSCHWIFFKFEPWSKASLQCQTYQYININNSMHFPPKHVKQAPHGTTSSLIRLLNLSIERNGRPWPKALLAVKPSDRTTGSQAHVTHGNWMKLKRT